MTPICVTKIDGYQVGHVPTLTEAQLREILPLLRHSPEENQTVLGGRRNVMTSCITGIGPVAVKSYARGGMPGIFVKETYLGPGKIRSLLEFEWLVTADDMGIPVPRPLACVWRGRLFYKCWLIMENIGSHQTLARMSLTDETRTRQLLPDIRKILLRLIHHHILHVDLHPGNILITDDDRLLIIDFDKARYFSGSKEKLIEKYARRWERAVQKYHLPSSISDVFSDREGVIFLQQQ